MSPLRNIYMTQIICLANSWKYGERCIAGIDLQTRSWIRPIYDRAQGGCVPRNVRRIDGKEPQILDVLDGDPCWKLIAGVIELA